MTTPSSRLSVLTKRVCFLFSFLPVLFVCTSSLAQTTRYVSTTGITPAASATSWAASTTDLQGAINASQSGDQVWVAAGVYKPTTTTGPDSRTISFSMKNGVAIYGGFAGNETSLNQRPAIKPAAGMDPSSTLSGEIGTVGNTGDNSYHVIMNPSGLTTTAVLDGFVITGGNANGSSFPDNVGGGVYNDGTGGCNPVFRNCILQNNAAAQGGAMYNYGGFNSQSSPVLTNCMLQSNSAAQGGAMYNSGNSTNSQSSPVLTNCILQSNSAATGGAMYNYGFAGGLSNPVLTNCTLQSNSAATGGAMLNEGNTGDALPVLTNCVFWRNGSIPFANSHTFGASATYSLFDDPASINISGPGNLTTTSSPFASATSVALAACSPAINAGDPTTTTATAGSTDLAGNPRIAGGRVDMGAVEYQPAQYPARLYVAASQTANAGDGLSWATAFPDLQSALTYPCSQSLTEIWVAQGVYKPTADASGNTTPSDARTRTFVMKNGVAIYGGFAGNEPADYNLALRNFITNETILSGDIDGIPDVVTGSGFSFTITGNAGNTYHVIYNNTIGLTNTARLDGFIVQGGNANVSTPPHNGGGGLSNRSGSTIISNCIFRYNAAYSGGGIYHVAAPKLTLENTRVHSNLSQSFGGGIFSQGTLSLTFCKINNNISSLAGGAIHQSYASFTIVNSELVNNLAEVNAGGLGVQDSPDATLINCIISNNSSKPNYQGGIVNFCSQRSTSILTLINCTVSKNRSEAGYRAIWTTSNLASQTALTRIRNTIVADNPGGNFLQGGVPGGLAGFGILETLGNNLDSDGSSGFTNGLNGDLVNIDPLFSDGWSTALSGCSPAINTGNPASVTVADSPYSVTALPAKDLAGNPRIFGSTVDMGAVEYQSPKSIPLEIAQQPVSGSAVCQGNTIVISVSVTGSSTAYQWYKSGTALTGIASATTASLTLANVQASDAGSYSVTISGDCNSVTSTAFSLTVNTLPSVTVTAAPSTTLSCTNPSLTLTAQTSATALLWSTGKTTATISVSTTGTYSVTATGTNGCSAVSNNLTIGENFSLPPFTVSSANVCPGQSVNLTASGCSGQILWSTGATTAMITLTAGSSTSTLIATCTAGICYAVTAGQVVVGSIQPPPAQILSFTADESACPVKLMGKGIATSFTMTGPNGYVFSTVFREGATHEAGGRNVKQAGTYTLTATYTNSCGTSEPVTRTVTVNRHCP